MPNQPNPVQETFSRDATGTAVAVVEGYGVRVRVNRGHLVIDDGVGRSRRTRRYSRAERTLRRVIVLGHAGSVSLEAIRWCADVGIAIHHMEMDGRVLAVSSSRTHDDARLRRAQAVAEYTSTDITVARYLIREKLVGQASVARDLFADDQTATQIEDYAGRLVDASVATCRDLESQAANIYFAAWYPHTTMSFARRDDDKIPAHWRAFVARSTPLHSAKTPRNAADPINALLNYAYSVLEAEATLAAQAVGLDPGLGVVHADKKQRASFSLDLMEATRPAVDRHVLTLLRTQVFRATDFHETRDGRCRVVAPLTHQIAANALVWHAALAPHAESVAHLFAQASTAAIKLRTPLTQSNVRAAQRLGERPQVRKVATQAPPRRCRDCGTELREASRQLCATCAPADLVHRGHVQITQAAARLAELRAIGVDPTATPAALRQRRENLRRNRAAMLAWQRQNPGNTPTREMYLREIQPHLAGSTISQLQETTGLSQSACSRIRSGKLIPHIRHWPALERLARRSSVEDDSRGTTQER